MSDYAHREKKNRIIGISVSVGLHVLLLVLFLWMTAWKEPYPPRPEYGIELNIGMDNTGSGNEPVAAEQSEDIEETPTEATEEVFEEEVEETTNSEAEDVVQEVSEPADEVVEEAVTDVDSPVKVEDSPTETAKETPKKEEKEEKKEEPKANPNALFPGDSKSQGETNDKTGDQGDPEGEVDAEAMMGPKGGGSGSTLNISGWKWDSPPRPDDPSEQRGKIIFEIIVDNNGEVSGVRTVQTTVSADIVEIYKDEVAKLTFSRTPGAKTASQSKGTITFLIRSN